MLVGGAFAARAAGVPLATWLLRPRHARPSRCAQPGNELTPSHLRPPEDCGRSLSRSGLLWNLLRECPTAAIGPTRRTMFPQQCPQVGVKLPSPRVTVTAAVDPLPTYDHAPSCKRRRRNFLTLAPSPVRPTATKAATRLQEGGRTARGYPRKSATSSPPYAGRSTTEPKPLFAWDFGIVLPRSVW
jgi:hypothetical protein